jgi:hypothetical protein
VVALGLARVAVGAALREARTIPRDAIACTFRGAKVEHVRAR